jgi:hypothetical protein
LGAPPKAVRRRTIVATNRPRPANRAMGATGAVPPEASHPPADTPAVQLPLEQSTPPETLMLSMLASAASQSGRPLAGTSMYCSPRPLPKSQNRAPCGCEQAVMQPPVQPAVADTSQLPFACAWQLPLQLAMHCPLQEALGACPWQLTLHWLVQLAEH